MYIIVFVNLKSKKVVLPIFVDMCVKKGQFLHKKI